METLLLSSYCHAYLSDQSYLIFFLVQIKYSYLLEIAVEDSEAN